jgi:hypothetical protein
MDSCPECGSSLWSRSTDAWVCSSCGCKEYIDYSPDLEYQIDAREMHGLDPYHTEHNPPQKAKLGRESGSFQRFYELLRVDPERALDYLTLMPFYKTDAHNRSYLASKLAIKLGKRNIAEEHLQFCLQIKSVAKNPSLIDKLNLSFQKSFGKSD